MIGRRDLILLRKTNSCSKISKEISFHEHDQKKLLWFLATRNGRELFQMWYKISMKISVQKAIPPISFLHRPQEKLELTRFHLCRCLCLEHSLGTWGPRSFKYKRCYTVFSILSIQAINPYILKPLFSFGPHFFNNLILPGKWKVWKSSVVLRKEQKNNLYMLQEIPYFPSLCSHYTIHATDL